MRTKCALISLVAMMICMVALGQGWTYQRSVNTIAELTNTSPANIHTNVNVICGTNNGDGYGGPLIYVAGSALTVDNIRVYAPSTGVGRWIRQGAVMFSTNFAMGYPGAINMRTSMNLGTMATQYATNVDIQGGRITNTVLTLLSTNSTTNGVISYDPATQTINVGTNGGLLQFYSGTNFGSTNGSLTGIGTNRQVAIFTSTNTIGSMPPTNNHFIVADPGGWYVKSASASRTALGLGDMATQMSTNVDITGGIISDTTIVLKHTVSTNPSTEGMIIWDAVNDVIRVGRGGPVSASTVFTSFSTNENRSALGLDNYWDVRWSGATNDGATPCDAAFTSAIATGKPIYVPEGTYLLTNELTVPANFVMRGEPGKTKLMCNFSQLVPIYTNTVIAASNNVNGLPHCYLSDNPANPAWSNWTNYVGIMNYVAYISAGLGSGQYRGIAGHTNHTFYLGTNWVNIPDITSTLVIYSNRSMDTLYFSASPTTNIFIIGITFESDAYNLATIPDRFISFNATDTRNVTIENCVFRRGYSDAIRSMANYTISNVVVRGCRFEEMGMDALYTGAITMHVVKNGLFDGNIFINCGGAQTYHAMYLGGGNPRSGNVVVVNNMIWTPTTYPYGACNIDLEGVTNGIIANNVINGNSGIVAGSSGDHPTSMLVSGNVIEGGSIYLSGFRGVEVKGNSLFNITNGLHSNPMIGISGCNNAFIENNTILSTSNGIPYVGMQIYYSTNVVVKGNHFQTYDENCITLIPLLDHLTISDNHFQITGPGYGAGIIRYYNTSPLTGACFMNNTFRMVSDLTTPLIYGPAGAFTGDMCWIGNTIYSPGSGWVGYSSWAPNRDHNWIFSGATRLTEPVPTITPYTNGLNALYIFNEGTGTNVTDISGMGNTAWIYGTPYWTNRGYYTASSIKLGRTNSTSGSEFAHLRLPATVFNPTNSWTLLVCYRPYTEWTNRITDTSTSADIGSITKTNIGVTNAYIGDLITITSGVGAGQRRVIWQDINGTYSVSTNWTVNPTASGFSIDHRVGAQGDFLYNEGAAGRFYRVIDNYLGPRYANAYNGSHSFQTNVSTTVANTNDWNWAVWAFDAGQDASAMKFYNLDPNYGSSASSYEMPNISAASPTPLTNSITANTYVSINRPSGFTWSGVNDWYFDVSCVAVWTNRVLTAAQVSDFIDNMSVPIWSSVYVSPLSVTVTGTNNPTILPFAGTDLKGLTWTFDGAASNSVIFALAMPHGYVQGTAIKPYIHWAQTTADSGKSAVWGLDYTWQNVDGTFAAPTEVFLTNAISGTAWSHQMNAFPTISGTGMLIDSVLVGRLFRLPEDTADDYTDGAAFLGIEFKHLVDAVGSTGETTK